MSHKVHVQQQEKVNLQSSGEDLIKQAVVKTLQGEAVDMLCVINVLITNDEEIRKFNLEYRDIDSSTDVLSFPMQDFQQAGWSGIRDIEIDEETGDLPLGDIIISVESVERQAEEYKNTIEYETAYLIIHSTLHLLGYDHDDEKKEKKMHEKNKQIMKEIGFSIDDK